jgi:hypothetical protein
MSLPRKRQHQPAAKPWNDPYDLSMALLEAFQAVNAGLACWIPEYERKLSPDEREAVEQAIKDADRMHERLTEERAVAGARRSLT